MSCTDDKTPCPCGPEMRRFEAADLKAAVLGENAEDEAGDYGSDESGWWKLENGVQVPNETYDAELEVEGSALYEAWRIATRGVWAGDSPEYVAYHAFRELHGAKLHPTKTVPWTFKWNGKELPITVVQNNGGREGGGEAVHMIYKVCDRLFRLDGSYYSYDGTTWDDDSFREVQAVTKAVVFYE